MLALWPKHCSAKLPALSLMLALSLSPCSGDLSPYPDTITRCNSRSYAVSKNCDPRPSRLALITSRIPIHGSKWVMLILAATIFQHITSILLIGLIASWMVATRGTTLQYRSLVHCLIGIFRTLQTDSGHILHGAATFAMSLEVSSEQRLHILHVVTFFSTFRQTFNRLW